MKRKGIKNLIFDFGGVLINLDRQRCVENFRKLGLEKVDELLGMYSQQGIFMQHEKGLISSAEFRENIRGLLTKKVTDEQIDAAWNSFLVDIPRFKLDMLLKAPRKICGLSAEQYQRDTLEVGMRARISVSGLPCGRLF